MGTGCHHTDGAEACSSHSAQKSFLLGVSAVYRRSAFVVAASEVLIPDFANWVIFTWQSHRTITVLLLTLQAFLVRLCLRLLVWASLFIDVSRMMSRWLKHLSFCDPLPLYSTDGYSFTAQLNLNGRLGFLSLALRHCGIISFDHEKLKMLLRQTKTWLRFLDFSLSSNAAVLAIKLKQENNRRSFFFFNFAKNA